MRRSDNVNERILVVGGTRGTGFHIVNLLLHGGYRVRAVARNQEQAKRKLSAAVEVVGGDITKPDTLPAVVNDVDHIIFTAGVTRRPAGERLIIATVYDGVKNTLAAARAAGFAGRFLYMTAIGVTKSSLAATVLNLVKRNTLLWRRRAEEEIRRTGFRYTIIRAGVLTNSPGGRRAIAVGQEDYPLTFRRRIGRADVAEAVVQALRHPGTERATFEVVWARGARREGWDILFGRVNPDA